MPFLAKVGSVLKSCVSASADFAGEQTMKLLKSQYPDINDVIVVLDQVKDRVKVIYSNTSIFTDFNRQIV